MESFYVLSRTTAQTQGWGRKLGKLLVGGEIIGLSGELGSGKTCFVRGLAKGLGVDREAWVRSPTFTLINEHEGRVPLYHIDLYRISGALEIEELNLREILYCEGVSVIEWVERMPGLEPEDYLHIVFDHQGGSRRRLGFTASGNRYMAIINQLTREGRSS
ncbi:MAG TPA: tRNA (adenosine(37)-N6)-threonylcarbamoyltransferase complex ATPase subunit type 1 TsaE [Candidatus Binatia bacterium]